jgi:hypothetical protein
MSTLARDISNAMAEIRSDKEIFVNFEIDSTFGKYSKIEGNSQIFDYWYNKFAEVKSHIDTLKDDLYQGIIEEFKTELQNLFKNSFSCYTDLNTVFKKYTNYTISMVRANIDVISKTATLMILYKTVNDSDPEDCGDYLAFQRDIYNIQEACNEQFSPQKFAISNLYWDENISVDCIVRDFPICIRNTNA